MTFAKRKMKPKQQRRLSKFVAATLFGCATAVLATTANAQLGGLGGVPGKVLNDPPIKTPATPVPKPQLPDVSDAVDSVESAANSAQKAVTKPLRLSNGLAARVGAKGNLGMKLRAANNAVIVNNLTKGSFGARAGFQQGDQILAVNKGWVRSYDDLVGGLEAAAADTGQAWVYVLRDGEKQWLNVDFLSQNRPKLGVNMESRNDAIVLTNIADASVAAKAGLQTGDQVLSVNDVAINTTNDLAAQVRTAAMGDGNMKIRIRRDGAEELITAKLATQATDAAAATATASALEPFGVGLAAKADDIRVANVTKGSAAARVGLANGDVIQSVNGVKVKTAAEAATQIDEAANADGKVKIKVMREGKPQTINGSLTLNESTKTSPRSN